MMQRGCVIGAANKRPRGPKKEAGPKGVTTGTESGNGQRVTDPVLQGDVVKCFRTEMLARRRRRTSGLAQPALTPR
jgi:hypothetical protein